MNHLVVCRKERLRGRVCVPGDKSISHRSLMLGALGRGTSRIQGFLPSGDCLATLSCMRALGITVEMELSDPAHGIPLANLVVHGRGLHGLQPPQQPLHCSRSGTTMRLLAGLLSGQSFDSRLTGDPQLLRRPMGRIVEPLRRMGAWIADQSGRAPLIIQGQRLVSADHKLSVASAQVKSCLMLAGLYATGVTTIDLPGPARDHTGRMLQYQLKEGTASLQFDSRGCRLDPSGLGELRPVEMTIPGDFSSAAFLMVAATLVKGSEITIEGVGVNPTRTGLIDVLGSMGADITLDRCGEQANEPVADITVRSAPLTGVEIGGETIVRTIDEFPVLAVAATQAEGTTVVRDAAELRVKETDRIATVVRELRAMGAAIEEMPDGFLVHGPCPLKGTDVDSHGDHRLAMALAIAGMVADRETRVAASECIADSFPGFEQAFLLLTA